MAKDETLTVRLLLAMKGFKSGLGKAQGLAKGFSKGITRVMGAATKAVGALAGVVGGVSTALFALVNSVATAGDTIAKMGRRTGLTTEYLSEMEYVLGLNDATIQDLQTGFRGLALFIDGVGRGTKEYTDLNKQLGVSLTDQHGRMKTSEELIDAYMEAIRRIRDPILQVGMAQRVFGKSAMKLLPAIQAATKGMAAGRAEARAMGLTLTAEGAVSSERFRDSLLRLWSTITGLKKTFGTPFMDTFSDAMDSISSVLRKLMPRVRALGKQAAMWVKIWGPKLLGIVQAFGRGLKTSIMPGLKGMWSVLKPMLSVLGVSLDAITGSTERQIATLKDAHRETIAAVDAGEDAISSTEAWARAQAKLDAVWASGKAEAIGETLGKLAIVLVEIKVALVALNVTLGGLKILGWVGHALVWLWAASGKLASVWAILKGVAGGLWTVLVAIKDILVGLFVVIKWIVVSVLTAKVLIIAAIAGLLVWIGYNLWKYWDVIVWMVEEGWKLLKAPFVWLWDQLMKLGERVGNALGEAYDAVVESLEWVWDEVTAWLDDLWTDVSGWFAKLPGRVWKAVKKVVIYVAEELWKWLTKWWGKTKNWVSDRWADIKATVGFKEKGSPSLKDVLADTMAQATALVGGYTNDLTAAMHGSMLAGMPRAASAGEAAPAAGPAVTIPVSVSGIMSDEFVRRVLVPEMERAAHMGLLTGGTR